MNILLKKVTWGYLHVLLILIKQKLVSNICDSFLACAKTMCYLGT